MTELICYSGVNPLMSNIWTIYNIYFKGTLFSLVDILRLISFGK